MKYKQLGATRIQLSAVIAGGWHAGSAGWFHDDAASVAALQAALDRGITTFDTAEGYGGGHSEEILGRALKGRRHEAVVCTKAAPDHMTAKLVREACERSLRYLDMDVIDLYQLHFPSGSFKTPIVPISETINELVELKSEGKIRAIGVSNFNRAQLAEALEYGPIDAIQPPYNLLRRDFEDSMELARERGMTIIGYSPLASGLLGGKFTRDRKEFPPGDNRMDNQLFIGEAYERAMDAIDQMRNIAERLGITVPQLAIAWAIAHPNTCAISGPRTVEQVEGVVAAGEVELDEATMAELDRISRPVVEAAGIYPTP